MSALAPAAQVSRSVESAIRPAQRAIKTPAATGRASKNTDQKRSTPIKRSKTSQAYLKYVDGAVLELNDLGMGYFAHASAKFTEARLSQTSQNVRIGGFVPPFFFVHYPLLQPGSLPLGEITLSFATCGTVHHWRAGSEVALET